MSQLGYTIDQAAALEGLIADNAEVQDIKSKRAEGSRVGFGKFVIKGTGDEDGALPAATFDLVAAEGVAVAAQTIEDDRGVLDPGYPENEAMNVMRKGRIWVVAEDIVTAGVSGVHVRYANGTLGALRGATVALETEDLSSKARWVTSTTGAGELAVLELDL